MALGFGMIFPNTSAAALSCVAPQRIGYASSLFNMMRNTGAAVGIAYMTNSLLSHQQIHQSRLVEHFSIFDGWRLHDMGTRLPGALTLQSCRISQRPSTTRDGLWRGAGAIGDDVV
jgi:hypothetical protein